MNSLQTYWIWINLNIRLIYSGVPAKKAPAKEESSDDSDDDSDDAEETPAAKPAGKG